MTLSPALAQALVPFAPPQSEDHRILLTDASGSRTVAAPSTFDAVLSAMSGMTEPPGRIEAQREDKALRDQINRQKQDLTFRALNPYTY